MSQCVCVHLPVVAGQRLGNNITAVTNAHRTIEEWSRRQFLRGPCCVK
jgi:hypothetical protein